jgi:hypothetical protein
VSGQDVLERLQALQDRFTAAKAADTRTIPTKTPEEAGLAPEPSYGEGVKSRVGRSVSGFSEMTGETALGLAAFSARKAGAEKVAQFFERGRKGLSKAAAGVYEEQRAKVDAFQAESGDSLSRLWEKTLPEAGGGMLGFALGGEVLGGTKAAIAATGAAQSAVQLYYEAKASGADEATATKAFLLGLPIGASEAFLGFGRRLGELDQKVGGAIGKRLVRIALDSGEEGAQEVVQQLAQNLTAQGLYDPERGWSEGVGEAGAAALVLGAIGGAAGVSAQALAPSEAAGGAPSDVQPAPSAAPIQVVPAGGLPGQGLAPVEGPAATQVEGQASAQVTPGKPGIPPSATPIPGAEAVLPQTTPPPSAAPVSPVQPAPAATTEEPGGAAEVGGGVATPEQRLAALMPAPEVATPAEAAPASAQEPMPEPTENQAQSEAPKAKPEPVAPTEVSAFPGGLLKLPGVREFASAFKRNLVSGGNLPPEVKQANIKRTAAAQADIQDIHFGLRDFHRAVKADMGKTPDQLSSAELVRMDQVLEGGTSESIPERVKTALGRMRDGIDRMSRRLIDSGAIEGDLVGHVEENIGFYAARGYRVHEDPKWAQEVPEDVRNKAKALFRKEYPDLSEEEIAGKIDELLFNNSAAKGPIAFIKQSKLGAKDLGLLTRRKQIAPEIRALYGEFKDPRINYARSVVRMAHMIANQQFLDTVRTAGLGKFLHEKPVVKNGQSYSAQIAAEGSEVMAPLNGLYTTPDIVQAFQDATQNDPVKGWLRVFLGINSVAKMGKTVGNPISAQRNLIGNVGFAMAQGHWHASNMAKAAKSVAVKWGITDSITDRMATLDSKPVADWRKYYRRALELGVIHEDSRSGEIRDAIRDAAGIETNAWLEKRTAKAIKLPIRAAIEYYRVGDDLWKIYAWENEKARYAKAKPDWTEQQVEEHAAQIVRNTYPTYSQVPRGVKLARRFPLTGPFLSFPAEVYRNAKNTALLIKEELADPDLRGIGATRAAWALTTATATSGIAVAFRHLLGITADDDDDARQFVPPWSKNSDLAWIQWGENGKARYIDLSYSDPWSYLKEPVLAVLRGDDPQQAAFDAAKAAADPLISEELVSEALIDWMRNTKKSGGQVYNPADTPLGKTTAVASHIWDAIKPGFIDTAKRIEMGLTGEVTAYGRSYDPKVEALAVMTGVRVTDLDPVQALNFLAGDYSKLRAQGARLGNQVFTRQGTVTDAELREAMESADTARRGAYGDIRAAIRAALNLGVPQEKVIAALQAGGVGKEEAARLLVEDAPEPWELSATTRREMKGVLGEQETMRRSEVFNATRVAGKSQ